MVSQNECYRLVTIKYIKNLIEQNAAGDKSLIQNDNGTYATIASSVREDYCPTYGEITGGTFVPYHKENTNPNQDKDGLVVNSRWYGDTAQTYANSQCVDRHDLSLAYTRLSVLNLSINKILFDACSGTSSSDVTYEYERTTDKVMTNCPTSESSITYGKTATTKTVACTATTDLQWHKTLPNTASTATCTSYSIGKNTGNATRYDDIYLSLSFRSKTYNSNTVRISQPAAIGAYSEPTTNTRKKPTGISGATSSPANHLVAATCDNDCVATVVNQPLSITANGTYLVEREYKYAKCGVIDTSKGTKWISDGSGFTPISTAMTWNASGSCKGDTAGQTITVASTGLTLEWSGFTAYESFRATATTKTCDKPVLECCQLHAPMSLTCSGTAQFEIGECGCDNMVDLGLPSGLKWGQYPLGTDEHYNTFKWYQWGNTEQYIGGEEFPDSWTGDVVTSHSADCVTKTEVKYETQLSAYSPDHECIKKNYPNSGYRMPTKVEAEELLAETTQEYVEDYNGTGRNGWKLTGPNGKHIFLPAAGEWYPDETGHTSHQQNNNYITYCWLGTGDYYYYWNDSSGEHCSASEARPDWATNNGFRITDLNTPHTALSVRESSRYYGNIIIPVCDKG